MLAARPRCTETGTGFDEVPELVDVTLVADALELVALGDDRDGEVLAALVPPTLYTSRWNAEVGGLTHAVRGPPDYRRATVDHARGVAVT